LLGLHIHAVLTASRAIGPTAVRRFKMQVRAITRRARGVNVEATITELAPYITRVDGRTLWDERAGTLTFTLTALDGRSPLIKEQTPGRCTLAESVR
jgi:hypothetical protein